MARRTEVPPNTSSIVHSSRYEWQDGEWLARRAEVPAHEAPMSIYEIHLASWRPGLTYRQLADQLPAYVRDLGFTHVELMPVAEHPFGGSWGYQVTGFYAPTARLGTPDDFKYLVDALHEAGIGVLMDWVPAHFPRDDWALAEFDGRPLYEHEDPLRSAHPDWGTLQFDFGRREVRNFLVANAVYWCEEFHIDGLRVDAVASMLYLDYSREPGQWVPNEHGGRENLDAVAFLQEMNATVYRRVPGVVTIAEESTAWDGVTRATHHTGPGGFGGLGFGLKWNMGWMHDSLGYVQHDPIHRKYHHHEMTFSMVYAYSENYVLPISHDEVVHGKGSLVSKMPGDWWQQRANERAYLGFMWAHPGKQLLFMGQEFAQGAEWSEAHGPDWWLLDPAYGAEADHRGVRDLVRDLNTVYRDTPALWQRDTHPSGFEWLVGDASEDNVFAFVRYDAEGAPLLSISNFSPVVRHDYRIGVPDTIPAWHEALNTDALRYGGADLHNPSPRNRTPNPGTAAPPASESPSHPWQRYGCARRSPTPERQGSVQPRPRFPPAHPSRPARQRQGRCSPGRVSTRPPVGRICPAQAQASQPVRALDDKARPAPASLHPPAPTASAAQAIPLKRCWHLQPVRRLRTRPVQGRAAGGPAQPPGRDGTGRGGGARTPPGTPASLPPEHQPPQRPQQPLHLPIRTGHHPVPHIHHIPTPPRRPHPTPSPATHTEPAAPATPAPPAPTATATDPPATSVPPWSGDRRRAPPPYSRSSRPTPAPHWDTDAAPHPTPDAPAYSPPTRPDETHRSPSDPRAPPPRTARRCRRPGSRSSPAPHPAPRT